MTQDEVIDAINKHFEGIRWNVIYRTRSQDKGAIGGADAILRRTPSLDDNAEFLFIEAEGEITGKDDNASVARSNAVVRSLGQTLKRIRIKARYHGVEKVGLFSGQTDAERRALRDEVAERATLERCRYVLALTKDYGNTIKAALDPGVAEVLHVQVFEVSPGAVAQLIL